MKTIKSKDVIASNNCIKHCKDQKVINVNKVNNVFRLCDKDSKVSNTI